MVVEISFESCGVTKLKIRLRQPIPSFLATAFQLDFQTVSPKQSETWWCCVHGLRPLTLSCRFLVVVTRLSILVPNPIRTSSAEDRPRPSPPMSIWSLDSSTINSFNIHRVSSFDDDNSDNLSNDSSNPPDILRVFSFDEGSSRAQPEEPIQFSRRVFSFDSCFDNNDDDEARDDLLLCKTMTAPTVLDDKDDSSASFIQVIGPSGSSEVGKPELVPLDICTWTSSSSSSSSRVIYHCDSIPRISDPRGELMQTTSTHSNPMYVPIKSFQVPLYDNGQVWNDDLTSMSSVSTMFAPTSSASGNTVPKTIFVNKDQPNSPQLRLEWEEDTMEIAFLDTRASIPGRIEL